MTESVELKWGVRASFLSYVEALRDGSVSVEHGAVRDGGVFRLRGRRTDANGFAFDGSLHFFGHAGALDVTLRDLRVRVDGATGAVTAAVSGVRIPVAVLAAAREGGGTTTFDEVAFTDDGAALLGGVYSTGAPADPLTIRVTD